MIEKILQVYTKVPVFLRRAVILTILFCFVAYVGAWIYLSLSTGEFRNFWMPFERVAKEIQS